MWSDLAAAPLLLSSTMLLCVAGFDGMVLFGLKMVEHFNRKREEKLSRSRYIIYLIFLFLTLPLLGCTVVAIYIINGDKISPVLAFQIGLTSPAIVQSLIIAAVDKRYVRRASEG